MHTCSGFERSCEAQIKLRKPIVLPSIMNIISPLCDVETMSILLHIIQGGVFDSDVPQDLNVIRECVEHLTIRNA